MNQIVIKFGCLMDTIYRVSRLLILNSSFSDFSGIFFKKDYVCKQNQIEKLSLNLKQFFFLEIIFDVWKNS